MMLHNLYSQETYTKPKLLEMLYNCPYKLFVRQYQMIHPTVEEPALCIAAIVRKIWDTVFAA